MQEIKNIFAEKCGIPVESITSDMPLSKAAEDSLSKIDLLFEVEQLIGKRLPEDEIIEMETFGDLLHSVKKVTQ